MEETSEALIYPTREEIVELNKYHIHQTGGLYDGYDNLKESGSLEWVLDAIQYPLFGVMQYPSIEAKAAQLAWIIIDGHVFRDGNKRTGMSALFIFLRANHYMLRGAQRAMIAYPYGLAATDGEVIREALNIATRVERNYTVADLTHWIGRRLSRYLLVNVR